MTTANTKAFNPRTIRNPSQDGPFYVIADGAPEHYVDGYGLCRGGSIVTLNTGVEPGRHMLEISPEDAAKGLADPEDAVRLSVLARARLTEKQREADLVRKRAVDTADTAAAEQLRREQAQQLADGIARAAEAERVAQEARDASTASEQRAAELQAQLDALRGEHAQLQTHAAALEAAAAAAVAKVDTAKDKPADGKQK